MPGRLSEALEVYPEEAAAQFLSSRRPGAVVVVALSGGGDSVGLLTALHDAAMRLAGSVKIAAITVDHGLRAASALEAAAMAAFCQSLSVPHLTRVWTGDKPSAGLLDAAREARYRLLVDGAEELGADCLVTAHTLDDQLETVEMRRARSEPGARGLAGIAPASLYGGRIWACRPFLAVRRAAIRAYLGSRGVGWIDDPSNEDLRFERVRLRRRGAFAMGPFEIASAQAQRQALSAKAADILDKRVSSPMPMLFTLDCTAEADDAFRLAFAALIAVAGGQTHLPGGDAIARVLERLADGGRSVSLGRTVIERRGGIIHICRDRRNLPDLVLQRGETRVWDGRFLIGNATTLPVRVVAGLPDTGRGGLPPRIAKRAASALPFPQGGADTADGLVIRPWLSPFETVLPGFDEALASRLCQLTGRAPLPPSLAFQSEKSDKWA